jgi:hypothetical protein
MIPVGIYTLDPFGGVRFGADGTVVSIYINHEGSVIRVHGFALYDLGSSLRPLRELSSGVPISSLFMPLVQARGNLSGIFSEVGPYRLPMSREAADNLAATLDSFMWDPSGPKTLVVGARFIGVADPHRVLATSEVDQVKRSLDSLESILAAEMGESDIWSVTEKGLYSTRKLIGSARDALSLTAQSAIWNSALDDYSEAGKCLAFERFTACGFHSLRSLESVIKQYVLTATGTLPPSNRQNWGEYIDQLGKSGATPSTVGTLRNIKDNHRNPLMHPEDVLDERGAISVFQLSGISIGELVDEIFTRGLTPALHP